MPAKQPNALLKLRGSKYYNPNEPEAPAAQDLRAPRGLLSPKARKFWKDNAETLQAMGVLTAADVPAFSLLAEFWALTWAAVDELKEGGVVIPDKKGATKKAPAAQLVRDFSTTTLKLMSEFGMLPASRGRLGVEAPEEQGLSLAEELALAVQAVKEGR